MRRFSDKPRAEAAERILSTAWTRPGGSRTTPFGANFGPTSNWGLTRTTSSNGGNRHGTMKGRTWEREMNDTSATAKVGRGVNCSGLKSLAWVFSRETTFRLERRWEL